MNRRYFIESHTLDFDHQYGTCRQCVNDCEDFDNYYYNHKGCLIRQNNKKRGVE